MLKLLFTIVVFLVLGLTVLGLRQQRTEITAATARLHHEITLRKHTLWGQEETIAKRTNPLVLTKGLKASGLLQDEAEAPADGAVPPRVDRDRDLTAGLRREAPAAPRRLQQ